MASRLGIAWHSFWHRPWWRLTIDLLLVLFALAGAAILGAWGLYQLGVTNNRGAVDKNYRYLAEVAESQQAAEDEEADAQLAEHLEQLARLAHRYPLNARLIMRGTAHSDDPAAMGRMLAALRVYVPEISESSDYSNHPDNPDSAANAIPWMNGPEWPVLKDAIAHDSALIREAGRLTGVEPRLIVGCLIGEQIRLFNSKRETFKKYLGPVKVLSVQSQFSYGVNGIKDATAEAVEQHLKDSTSEFYMGRAYEHLLDFETDDHETERYNRLVDYHNHLYSYIYTACILHQTMLQWRRAGYDISNRPDVLFTLFNLGFDRSVPKADPMPGGSTLTVGERDYTFGAIGFDFYYSGELADIFPIRRKPFVSSTHALTAEEVARIQDNMSDCERPEKGLEYRRQDSVQTFTPYTPYEDEEPDPFGIDHSRVRPIDHTAQ